MGSKFKKLIIRIKKLGLKIKEYKIIDPVCNMEMGDNFIVLDYKGQKYHFCSQDCQAEFKSNPEKFIS